MVTLVKNEWHQTQVIYALELDEGLLSEIYPDLTEEELSELLKKVEEGEVSVDEIVEDAYDNEVDLEWDHQYDDMWTMRKGGYDVSYDLGDESSWHQEPPPPEPTHKCSNCKWTGQKYDGDFVWEDKDGNALEQSKHICPYCESDIVLTEHGKLEEEQNAKRLAEIKEMLDEPDE